MENQPFPPPPSKNNSPLETDRDKVLVEELPGFSFYVTLGQWRQRKKGSELFQLSLGTLNSVFKTVHFLKLLF